mgnify:CR=1 FL=1
MAGAVAFILLLTFLAQNNFYLIMFLRSNRCIRGFKILVAVFVCFACRLFAADEGRVEETEKPVLRILNWTEFVMLDDSVPDGMSVELASPILREFAEANDCLIEYSEYEDAREILRLATSMPGYFDLFITSQGEIIELNRAGFLESIDTQRIKNYRNLDNRYLERMNPEVVGVTVPYLMGTTGIAYRSDLVEGEVNSLRDIFYPAESLKGKIGILGDEKTIFSLLLTCIGYDVEACGEREYRWAALQLNALKEEGYIVLVSSSVDENVEALNSGRIAMTIMFSGDALSAHDNNPLIKYVVPKEGGEGFTDRMAIASSSKKKDLAYRFIDYVLDARVGADNAMYLNYATPNKAARSIIEKEAPEQIANPAIYPPKEIEEKLYEVGEVPELATRFWGTIFN